MDDGVIVVIGIYDLNRWGQAQGQVHDVASVSDRVEQLLLKQDYELIVARLEVECYRTRHRDATISAAVEQQSATTRHISRNTGEAAAGARDVTRHIVDVQREAQETGEAASQVVIAASDLGRQAENLREQVDNFLSKLRTG